MLHKKTNSYDYCKICRRFKTAIDHPQAAYML